MFGRFGASAMGLAALRRLARFARDRQGGYAVAFSVAAPTMIILIGLGLDYLNGLSFKSRWDTALDAAALKANQTAEAYAQANASSQSYVQVMQNAEAVGEAAGLAAFNANSGASSLTGSVTPSFSMSYAGTTFTTVASYSASIGSHFGGLVGNDGTIAVKGAATATQRMATYINYYILVDISQSMGIGSTQTDMTNLYNLTQSMGYTSLYEPGCVFGCHVAQPASRPLTNEQVAHGAGITLRIDAAKTAIQNVISGAAANAISGNIKIALYTMQDNPSTNSYQAVNVASLSNVYSSLTTASQSIDLGGNTAAGVGDTDLTDTIEYFAANTLPANGTGLSANSPLNYVFIITDGMMDLSGSCPPTGHCTGVIPNQTCSQLQQNATVGVIYTTYLPIYQNNNANDGYDPDYQVLVLPYQSSIQPSLQNCASSSQYFFQAEDGPALIAAMDQLFAETQSTLRLSQ